jgi:uncharacterized protein (TIGR02246 family)
LLRAIPCWPPLPPFEHRQYTEQIDALIEPASPFDVAREARATYNAGAPLKETMVKDEQVIRETILNWLAASKEGDSQSLAAMLDDDMLFVVRGRSPFGKQEFLAGSQGKPYAFDATADVREVVVNGNWALTRVELVIEFTATMGAKKMRLIGPTMTVWRKSVTGRWLIWRDANMVAPAE